MRPLALAVFAVLMAAGCIELNAAAEPTPPLPAPVRFLAIGDMGTGDANQVRVAAGMKTVCEREGCDFVVGLGDNIYEAGATSPYDPQFQLKFEAPYAAFGIPFYMVLGNHDNLGVRSGHAGGDVQVLYAARDDRAMDQWVMPARWYEHSMGGIRFLAIDTNVVFAAEAPTPALSGLLSADVDGVRQMAWIQERLADNATWDWTFVHGHHPLHSNGEHGDAARESPALGAWLQQAVCGGQVDLVLAGHDHDLQWLPAKPETCGGTEFLVSGAAAQTRPITEQPNEALFACGDTLGFAWLQVQGERLTARMHDADGNVLFERVLDRADPGASTATTYTERTASCSPL